MLALVNLYYCFQAVFYFYVKKLSLADGFIKLFMAIVLSG